jgi:hypothetical protein
LDRSPPGRRVYMLLLRDEEDDAPLRNVLLLLTLVEEHNVKGECGRNSCF